MSLRINQNILAMETYKTVSNTSGRLEKSVQKLSSGLRINSAADDAAGLAISEKMRRQIRGLSRAIHNGQDGISMIQTAEGAMNETHSVLQRLRELAIQAANDTLTSNDRIEIQKEVDELKNELSRIAYGTEFNTRRLLNGSQTALLSTTSSTVKGYVVGDIYGSAMYDISLETLKGGVSEMHRSQIFTLNDGSGKLADGGTQLQSISQFYNEHDVFALASPQILTIYGNGRSADVNIDGQMTLDGLAASIQNAISRASGLDIKNSKVIATNTAQTRLASIGGYLEIVSGAVGEVGSLSFASDQRLLDSLGIGIQREAVESQFKLSADGGHGLVRRIDIQGNRARGLLSGIDLEFTSQAAQISGFDGIEQGLVISSSTTGDLKFVISAAGKSVTINVSQGYWTMQGLVRNFNKQFEDANMNGLIATLEEGEIRLAYSRPVSVSASVPNTIVIDNSLGGAKAIGFMTGTYVGFVDGQKDPTQARWGFSSYVNATTPGKLTFSVGDGTQRYATIDVALTDKVTVSDMVQFAEFQSEFNKTALTNSVKVRVDQVGASMVFTALRVGTEHRSEGGNIDSVITLGFNQTSGKEQMLNRLGLLDDVVSLGSGDTNFRFNVVDSSVQFQIGADQGQVLNFGISDMSTSALGLDRLNITTIKGANRAIGDINKAIDLVSSERTKLGAIQNRLEISISNMRNTHSNLSASESRIRDADIALEMVEFTRNQIISQAGMAMMSQSNAVTQSVLQLIQ